ncbi:hypothetical protein Ahy_A06g028197 [Arachis hypogaea]|uniref:Uncharacterized protein n=1 Tax=Arachis hypogaea TaxID=3818 RepID=A0A445CQH9_ARAHY|nr:hypothetical protein Ahy_A06g028197 [Arachis hypogaea]
MPPPAMDTMVLESSHGSQPADAPPPPSIFLCAGELYMGQGARCLIRKIYDHRMSRRLQQLLEDEHERCDHLTSWLCPKVKKALYVHWETDEGFRHRHLTNRANRASTRSSKYTGGTATFIKTKARLSNSLDRDATLVETFKYTQENKTRFVDQWSIDYYVQELTWSQHEQAQELNKTWERYQEILTRITDTDELKLEWREQQMAVYQTQMRAAAGGTQTSLLHEHHLMVF